MHMRNLRSRVYDPLPPMPVSVQPCWYSGSPAESARKFNDFKRFITEQDHALKHKIDDIKSRGSISESGNNEHVLKIF